MWAETGGALSSVGTGTLVGALATAFGTTMYSLFRAQKLAKGERDEVVRERDFYRERYLTSIGVDPKMIEALGPQKVKEIVVQKTEHADD